MTFQMLHVHERPAACLANEFCVTGRRLPLSIISRRISIVRGQVLLQFKSASERSAALKANVPKIGSMFKALVALHGYLVLK